MKIEEFTGVTKEIENFYQKEITEDQKKIWFDNLKGMDIKRFKYIISQIYKTCKFLPKLADIVEMNNNIGYEKKNEINPTKNCSKCNNTGYITYKKIITNGDKKIENEYMAVCSCKRQKQYKGWEISEDRYKTNYYTPMAAELGL